MGEENTIGYQSQKETLDAPLDGILPNILVAKEIKCPNHINEQEPIRKENKTGDKSQKETIEVTLYVIPPIMYKW